MFISDRKKKKKRKRDSVGKVGSADPAETDVKELTRNIIIPVKTIRSSFESHSWEERMSDIW